MKNIMNAPFVEEMRKTTANMYRLGWDERNGGNISYLLDDETKEICKEIVRCGGLEGSVKMALDYFDASINRISAWTVGFRNVQKALLMALCTPDLTAMQNADNWTELMVVQEELKTMPFGEVWTQYCRECGAPADGEWFATVKQYEADVLSQRG